VYGDRAFRHHMCILCDKSFLCGNLTYFWKMLTLSWTNEWVVIYDLYILLLYMYILLDKIVLWSKNFGRIILTFDLLLKNCSIGHQLEICVSCVLCLLLRALLCYYEGASVFYKQRFLFFKKCWKSYDNLFYESVHSMHWCYNLVGMMVDSLFNVY
jgi:hypothetical protein